MHEDPTSTHRLRRAWYHLQWHLTYLKHDPLPVAALGRLTAQRTLFTIRQYAPQHEARQLSQCWLQALQLAQIASDRCATACYAAGVEFASLQRM